MEKGCRPGFEILMVRNPVDAFLYNEGNSVCLSSIFDEGSVA
jgi:hypothetical protein